jgi:hypothetical protein
MVNVKLALGCNNDQPCTQGTCAATIQPCSLQFSAVNVQYFGRFLESVATECVAE